MVGALASLVPHGALRRALAPRSRAPGALSWHHELIDDAAAAGLLGVPVPVLPSLRAEPGGDVEQFTSVHRGVPTESLRSQLDAGALVLNVRVAYVPGGQRWEQVARWPLVLQGGSVLEVWAQEPDPQRGRAWPQRLGAPDGVSRGDWTEVLVAGRRVGVQVDGPGVTHLSWVGDGGEGPLLVSLLTRRSPRAALELVVGDGLLP